MVDGLGDVVYNPVAMLAPHLAKCVAVREAVDAPFGAEVLARAASFLAWPLVAAHEVAAAGATGLDL